MSSITAQYIRDYRHITQLIAGTKNRLKLVYYRNKLAELKSYMREINALRHDDLQWLDSYKGRKI